MAAGEGGGVVGGSPLRRAVWGVGQMDRGSDTQFQARFSVPKHLCGQPKPRRSMNRSVAQRTTAIFMRAGQCVARGGGTGTRRGGTLTICAGGG